MRHRAFACIAALMIGAAPATAQNLGGPLDTGLVQSPVLVVDFETLYSQSAFGQRIQADIEADGLLLATENRQIEADLNAEERALTAQRDTMAADEFRVLAAAFDEKVQKMRRDQDAKARAITGRREAAQRIFLTAARPVLQDIMQQSNAAVMLERRAVILTSGAIDITDNAIRQINASLGDGQAQEGATAASPSSQAQEP
jgi:Skp family chaperone for outer membrane proteins